MVGPDSVVHLLTFLLKIRSVRILDTIVCSGTLRSLFSPAWDAVELTLQVGFIGPFVVIDATDLGATIVVAKARCLTFVNISPTQNTSMLKGRGCLKRGNLQRLRDCYAIPKQSRFDEGFLEVCGHGPSTC